MATKMIVCTEINDHRCSIGPGCSFESAEDPYCSNGHEKGKEYPVIHIEEPGSSEEKQASTLKLICQRYPDDSCSVGTGCRFEGENTTCTGGHEIGKWY